MHPDSFRVHGRGPLQRALAQTSTRVVRRARGSAPQAAGLHVEASAAPFKTALHGPESAGPPSTPATRQALCARSYRGTWPLVHLPATRKMRDSNNPSPEFLEPGAWVTLETRPLPRALDS